MTGTGEEPAVRAERLRREREWVEALEKRIQERNAVERARRLAEAQQAERDSWADGERGGAGSHTEVTGPDGVPVRIAVVRLSRGDAVARAFQPSHGPSDFSGGAEVLLLVVPYLLLLGLYRATRRLVRELRGRPRWAVVAAVGPTGRPAAVLYGRDEEPVIRAATALAERVEQRGAAAVPPPLP
ncbi:hypothetical protein Kpho02_20400 [Kitasatospora phosalacinea]|uniref:Uncharacterized protein n=1 Tax=Kitasatospora phosalacinea TaxID=2065 RepID=A0A9W6Q768_9ACTN|nr:hypothetical protein [Kitasatospora phosalacinea]GLW69741.1 hypothetical protein Kpho02_20400 [Kitasatospora phosalacinea]